MHKLALLLPLLAAAMPVRAQSFDASQWTQGTTTIDSLWRFHPGDNQAWASPSFDDSSWPLLSTGQKWGSQGYPDLNGYAWYRLRLKLPSTSQLLGIDVGHINSAAEIYVDGRLLGENGIMRPRPDWTEQNDDNAFSTAAFLQRPLGRDRRPRLEKSRRVQLLQRRILETSGRGFASAPSNREPRCL